MPLDPNDSQIPLRNFDIFAMRNSSSPIEYTERTKNFGEVASREPSSPITMGQYIIIVVMIADFLNISSIHMHNVKFSGADHRVR